MDNAIVYLRFSPRPDAAECESLANQLDRCQAYCAMTKLQIVEVIEDPEVSALKTPLQNRPGGSRLFAMLKAGAASHVVAYRLDRLWRDVADGSTCLRLWAKRNIIVHFSDQGGTAFHNGTATGRFILNVLLATAQHEAETTSERVSHSFARRQSDFRRITRHPRFGYSFAANAEGQTCEVPNQTEQNIARQIRASAASGLSLGAIARSLSGVSLTGRTRQHWDATMVKRVLKGPAGRE